MLLGPNPMHGLIDSAALLQVDTPETVGGELCHTLRVTRGPSVLSIVDQPKQHASSPIAVAEY